MRLAARSWLLDQPCAVYRLACGHDAPAPAPSLSNGDGELRPAFVDCPICGVPRRPIGYEAHL